jgi:hypothetical protein
MPHFLFQTFGIARADKLFQPGSFFRLRSSEHLASTGVLATKFSAFLHYLWKKLFLTAIWQRVAGAGTAIGVAVVRIVLRAQRGRRQPDCQGLLCPKSCFPDCRRRANPGFPNRWQRGALGALRIGFEGAPRQGAQENTEKKRRLPRRCTRSSPICALRKRCSTLYSGRMNPPQNVQFPATSRFSPA